MDCGEVSEAKILLWEGGGKWSVDCRRRILCNIDFFWIKGMAASLKRRYCFRKEDLGVWIAGGEEAYREGLGNVGFGSGMWGVGADF